MRLRAYVCALNGFVFVGAVLAVVGLRARGVLVEWAGVRWALVVTAGIEVVAWGLALLLTVAIGD
jgi:hypothetical protein